ncbi:hypothetical protein RND71_034440 [Anisodus tanguticus]|uniref:Inhibitor I9 domain-containing protein n=1 Tax=Anisodus tanguticus TaxID=243964 RepID=A0AAE1V2K8_9SOLA|nr:hypothetical protein RND71_034440 [Anisodus tanguticus]
MIFLLRRVLRGEKYLKVYNYHYLINGFAVLVTLQQAFKLARRRQVSNIALDFSVRLLPHTPEFLGLPRGPWAEEGGYETAGEGVVTLTLELILHTLASVIIQHILFLNTSSGICEVTLDFPSGSCNRKLVGARHFAASAITRGIFNATKDYASPFDGDGHGT